MVYVAGWLKARKLETNKKMDCQNPHSVYPALSCDCQSQVATYADPTYVPGAADSERECHFANSSVELSSMTVVCIQTILEQCCLSGSAFNLFLHQNYLNFFDTNSIDDVTNAAEYLSVADSMNSPLTSSDPSSGASIYMDRYEGIE